MKTLDMVCRSSQRMISSSCRQQRWSICCELNIVSESRKWCAFFYGFLTEKQFVHEYSLRNLISQESSLSLRQAVFVLAGCHNGTGLVLKTSDSFLRTEGSNPSPVVLFTFCGQYVDNFFWVCSIMAVQRSPKPWIEVQFLSHLLGIRIMVSTTDFDSVSTGSIPVCPVSWWCRQAA